MSAVHAQHCDTSATLPLQGFHMDSGVADPASRHPELDFLVQEMEMLVQEDAHLMKIAGAAALFISQLDGDGLSSDALRAATMLARLVNQVPQDTMSEALHLLGRA